MPLIATLYPATLIPFLIALLIATATIGFLACGTYEFTSYAIIKDWTFQIMATGLVWGTALTAASFWIGVTLTRLIFKEPL